MPKKTWNEKLLVTTSVQTTDCNRVFNSIHNNLLSLGLTQTADTGQFAGNPIVLGNGPTSGNTVFGYRVYSFEDSLSATDPLFLKVYFRSYLGNLPGISIEFGGPTTDGAGNIANSIAINLGCVSSTTTSGSVYVIIADAPCHIIKGDGYIAFASHLRSLINSSSYSGLRPDGIDVSLDMGWTVVGRPTDINGQLLPGKVAGIDPGRTSSNFAIATSGNVGFYYYGYYAPFMKAKAWNQAERSHENFCSLLLSGGVLERDGSVPVGRCYADFGADGLLPFPWVGGVSHAQMGNMDTTDLTLFGSTPKTYVHLGKCLLSMTSHRLLSFSDGKVRFTSPIIQWDGVDI